MFNNSLTLRRRAAFCLIGAAMTVGFENGIGNGGQPRRTAR